MGNVSLIAVGIDDVRELFSGSEKRIAELRDVTERTWPSQRQRRGFMRRPFSRRTVDDPVAHPGVPTQREIDAVSHGRDVPPDRLVAAWVLVGAWLGEHSLGRFEFEVDRVMLEALDFDLATCSVPADLSLRTLFRRPAGLPLKPLPGQLLGYATNTQATAMASHWQAALPALNSEHRAVAEPIASWLANFPDWTRQAVESSRPVPDLMAAYRA